MLYLPKSKKIEKQIDKYAKGKEVIFVSQAAVNMCWSRLICKFVLKRGFVPVNYFTAFGHFVHELADQETMIDSINSLVLRCDELWVFGEISEGMWYEIKMCKEVGIPVKYFDIDSLPNKTTEIQEDEVRYLRKFREKIKRYKKFSLISNL